MPFEFDNSLEDSNVSIKVIGIGGGGNNAVNRMIATNIRGVQFVAINTDKQALRHSDAPNQLVIGEKITKGFGAGANPDNGRRAAEESMDEIRETLKGADMVFITAGMGGGTGTGAAPIIAKIAKEELKILTVGIVTKPFAFEGKKRMDQANQGIVELSPYVDSLIVIPNERLKQVSETRITLRNAFAEADDVLRKGVQSISELINIPQYINLDFADVSSVMASAGYAHMGVGSGKGDDKAEVAAKNAISSPLLETSIKGARGILISITASVDVGLDEIDAACSMIHDEANKDANIIWGCGLDETLEDEMRITVIATGFGSKEEGNGTPDMFGLNRDDEESGNKEKTEREPAEPAEPAKSAERPERTEPKGEKTETAEPEGDPEGNPEGGSEEKAAGEALLADTFEEQKETDISVSDSDFDQIMSILRKSRNRNA